MTTPTTVLRVGEPRDLLAYVPFRLGYRPRQSLVVLCLRGPRRRVGAVLRLDLPGGDGAAPSRAPAALVEVVAGHARRDGAGAAVLVAYAEPPGPSEPPGPPEPAGSPRPGPGHRPPAAALVRSLAAGLRRRGIEVPEAWHVGSGRYRSYLCADRACCPPQGRPLTDLDASLVAPELVARGASIAGDGAGSLLTGLDPAPSQVARAVEAARLRARAARGEPGSARRRRWRREGLAAWQTWLAAVAAEVAATAGGDRPVPVRDAAERLVDDDTAGRLLAGLGDLVLRDAVLLTAVPGPDDVPACLAGWDAARPMPARVVAALDGVFGPRDPSRRAAAVPEPDASRQEAFDALLAVLVRRAEPGHRAPALALLAWSAWFAGDGGRARLLVERALADDHGHGLATLVGEALARGLPPAWVDRQREADAAGAGAAAVAAPPGRGGGHPQQE